MKIFTSLPKHIFHNYRINNVSLRAVSQLLQEPSASSYLDCFMTTLPEPALKVIRKVTKIKKKKMLQNAKIHIAHNIEKHLLQDLPNEIEINQADAKIFYKRMLAMRHIKNLVKETQLETGLAYTNGHEASAVALRAAMSYNDILVSTKRSFGSVHQLDMLSEITANVVVPRRLRWVKGRVRRHINQLAFFGVNGNTAAQIPLANGIAFARKFSNEPGTILALYGDECINQGQLFETLQIASKLNLPYVFVYENDGKGITSGISFYKSFKNIPGIRVNGSVVSAVYGAAKYAVQYAQKQGPLILEICHNFTENEEHQMDKTIDPVQDFSQLCIRNELISENNFHTLDKSIESEVKLLLEKRKTNQVLFKRIDLANSYFTCLESKILNEDYFYYKYAKKLERSTCLCS